MAGINDSSNPFPSYPFTLSSLLGGMPTIQKRKAYFAFHFDDIMRVNNVRQAWKIDHPDAPLMRSFYDSSLWEKRQIEGPESLKNLIREGVEYTSAVCVLVGSDTWSRRWVRYEIARAVIDERGLLAVHLNNIRHHVRRQPDACGRNPLTFMAVGKVQPNQPNPFLGQRNALAGLLAREEAPLRGGSIIPGPLSTFAGTSSHLKDLEDNHPASGRGSEAIREIQRRRGVFRWSNAVLKPDLADTPQRIGSYFCDMPYPS
jgi:hypothetical protein